MKDKNCKTGNYNEQGNCKSPDDEICTIENDVKFYHDNGGIMYADLKIFCSWQLRKIGWKYNMHHCQVWLYIFFKEVEFKGERSRGR